MTIAVVAGFLAVFTLLNPDLALQLRTQIPIEITRVEKTLTWTPGSDTPAGDRVITVVATDEKGASATKDITITVTGSVEGIADVEIVPEATRATVRWKTTGPATPRIEFDLNDQLRKNLQEDPTVQQTDHEVVLDNLIACTNYIVKVKALLATETLEDIERAFTTAGCTGDATVKGLAKDDVPSSQERVVALSDKIVLTIPPGALAQDGHVQIHQLDRDQALSSISPPESDLSPVTGLYEVTAYADANTKLTSFNQPIEVSVAYTPTADTDTSTLALWRYDGSAWSKLDNCVADTSTQTVTCTTTQFSAVAGFSTGGGSGDEEGEQQQESSSGGDSGGGGGGGGGESSTPTTQERTYTYQAESVHKIEGPYSSVVPGGSGKVAKIASNKSLLSKNVQVTPDNYWLDIRVKHDKPGPVSMAVYLNNRAWKVIQLTKADNQYHTHRVGLLRNFRQETIRFRLLNDAYNKAAPTDEEQDRNLLIDWWRLTTDDNAPASVPSGSGGSGIGTRSTSTKQSNGWSLVPTLNTIIRQELGNQYVRLDIWQYYARRLTLPASDQAAIQTEAHLRSVMQYWKGIRPDSPRGDTF